MSRAGLGAVALLALVSRPKGLTSGFRAPSSVLSSVGGGCWTKLSPVRCHAGDCLLLWRLHRLGEALDAADEFGALRIRRCAAADVRLDEVCGPLGDGRKQDVRAVLLLESCAIGQVDGGAIGVTPRQTPAVRAPRLRRFRSGSSRSDESIRVRPRRASGNPHSGFLSNFHAPGLSGEPDRLGGCGICRCDLCRAGARTRRTRPAEKSGPPGPCRSRRADDAVENIAGVRPLLDQHQ